MGRRPRAAYAVVRRATAGLPYIATRIPRLPALAQHYRCGGDGPSLASNGAYGWKATASRPDTANSAHAIAPIKGSSGEDCARSWRSRTSGRTSSSARTSTRPGQMPSSRRPDCSRYTQPGNQRDSPDEETTNWRAVCGKTARTVRGAGWRKPSRPLSWTACPCGNDG